MRWPESAGRVLVYQILSGSPIVSKVERRANFKHVYILDKLSSLAIMNQLIRIKNLFIFNQTCGEYIFVHVYEHFQKVTVFSFISVSMNSEKLQAPQRCPINDTVTCHMITQVRLPQTDLFTRLLAQVEDLP